MRSASSGRYMTTSRWWAGLKRWTLLILCLPVNLSGLLVVGLLLLFRAAQREPVVGAENVLVVRGRGRFVGWWGYSTTFGSHVIYMHPEAGPHSLLHELKHTSQAEGVSCAWALATLGSWSWRMLVLWPAAWFVVYIGASISSWLKGRDWYYGNEYEQQAYRVEEEPWNS